MTITRTANAGALINLDGVSMLFDGVTEYLPPYEATDMAFKDINAVKNLSVLGFTHEHPDHIDLQFLKEYKKLAVGTVIGPNCENTVKIGQVTITPVPTRHIGKSDICHKSFIIKGSKTVFFMGDASPSCLKLFKEVPDVVIAPFAYANTQSSLALLKSTGARLFVILHMPQKDKDEYGLWTAVQSLTKDMKDVIIPQIRQQIIWG